MKAAISSTYDDMYFFNLPITTWCWNKIGVDVICFLPNSKEKKDIVKLNFASGYMKHFGEGQFCFFDAPKNKQATYAQNSRLYAACLDIAPLEYIVTGDIDMLVFCQPPRHSKGFTIWGYDLVPPKQYPMCYLSAQAQDWRDAFNLDGLTVQQALDRALAHEECENMRGNLWCRDQENAFNAIYATRNVHFEPRSNGRNQFAQHRVDRDDINWRAHVNTQLIDAHLWRPPYEAKNFSNILELLTAMFPSDNFDWLLDYWKNYIKLI